MTPLSHPRLRITGLILAAFAVFMLDTQSSSPLHALWLPLLLAVAAYLMSQAPMAVAFATLALAFAHTDLASPGWVEARAYPVLATLSLGVCAAIGWRRFKVRIAATHDARWAGRANPGGDQDPPA